MAIGTERRLGYSDSELGRTLQAGVIQWMGRIQIGHVQAAASETLPEAGIIYGEDAWRRATPAQLEELKGRHAFTQFDLGDDFDGTAIRAGAVPSRALRRAIDGPSIAGCHSATMMAHLATLLDVIGEEKFDHLFRAEGPTPLNLHGKKTVWLRHHEMQEMRFEQGGWYMITGVGPHLGALFCDSGFSGHSYNVICNNVGGGEDLPTFLGLWNSARALTPPGIFDRALAGFRAWDGAYSTACGFPDMAPEHEAALARLREQLRPLRRLLQNQRFTPEILSGMAERLLPDDMIRPFHIMAVATYLREELVNEVLDAETPEEVEAITRRRLASHPTS